MIFARYLISDLVVNKNFCCVMANILDKRNLSKAQDRSAYGVWVEVACASLVSKYRNNRHRSFLWFASMGINLLVRNITRRCRLHNSS